MIRGEKRRLVVKLAVNKTCFVSHFKKSYLAEHLSKLSSLIDICIGRDTKNVRDINIPKGVTVQIEKGMPISPVI